jgi:hypothetical protein
MIKKEFVSDAPQNRWWLFGSWHDQPNRDRGETWAKFPAHSPPIAIGYVVLKGVDNLAFVYGSPNSSTIGMLPFTREQWHKVAVRIVWSRGANGLAEVRLDDSRQATFTARGPNMHNDFPHYLKVGMYRHPSIPGDTWIYLRDVNIRRDP